MKNAIVLVHHYGDDGNVSEGMILKDVPTRRFEELEKRGLVREATDDEFKAGYQPAFEAEQVDEGDEKKSPEPANKKAPAPANKAA